MLNVQIVQIAGFGFFLVNTTQNFAVFITATATTIIMYLCTVTNQTSTHFKTGSYFAKLNSAY
jgi:hypothetical protein